MGTSLIDSDSLLAVDVGAVHTRALLFDVVDGRYRYLATGTAPTTAGYPYFNIREGIQHAVDSLQETTGRVLVGSDGSLILPSKPDGTGVDTCVATLSAGAPLKVVVVGLLDDVSTESASRLATTTYAQVVDKISLTDRRQPAERLDTILRAHPDLIIVAGGTEGGATQSILNLLESIGLACYILPESERPELLYAGNGAMAEEVGKTIGSLARLSIAPNVRPSLEVEQIAPAQKQLSQLYRAVRSHKLPGAQDLDGWAGGHMLPTATAFGRMIRFLSKVYDPHKGVFGLDMGASALTLAAAFSGDLTLGVYSDLGLGYRVNNLLKESRLEDISRWMPVGLPENEVRDYIYNKSLHPQFIPETTEELAIEQAITRRLIQIGMRRLMNRLPQKPSLAPGVLPPFEPIVASGSVFTQAANSGQALLMLLDGLQPGGVTTIVLDQNNVAGALGSAAEINPYLPVQVLESNAFMNLGTVISPIGSAAIGTPVMRMRVSVEGGSETSLEIKFGNLEVIPLPPGKNATLNIQPINRFDIGMGGLGRGGSVRVSGGALGIIVDARGRPIRLPSDPERRREVIKKWHWMFGS